MNIDDLNDTAKPQKGRGNQQDNKFTNKKWYVLGAFIAVAVVAGVLFS